MTAVEGKSDEEGQRKNNTLDSCQSGKGAESQSGLLLSFFFFFYFFFLWTPQPSNNANRPFRQRYCGNTSIHKKEIIDRKKAIARSDCLGVCGRVGKGKSRLGDGGVDTRSLAGRRSQDGWVGFNG